MRPLGAGHYTDGTAFKKISSLTMALARLQLLADTDTITMARKIGFTMGRELALKTDPRKYSGIDSELSSLFRRLNLGRIILHEWEPVVFVTRPDSKSESVEGAFGEGVLEGVMDVRSPKPVFVEHYIPMHKRGILTGIVSSKKRSVR